ncbi:MAG: SDR family NAD(P)-dependent oxidoreductase [Blautia sp.]
MNIAIVTGASSGMGAEFVRQIGNFRGETDEIWVLARNKKALQKLQKQTRIPLRILALDITKRESLQQIQEILKQEKPCVRYLVNAAGCGVNKKTEEISPEDCSRMLDVNCRALTMLTRIILPYCQEKSRILMVASAAAFLPQAGFAIYAASKAYVFSFSRALSMEVKKRGIIVTIVCPGPVDTAFLDSIGGKEKIPAIKRPFIAKPDKVVACALKCAKKGKELSIYGFSMKCFFMLCKIVPHGVLLKAVDRIS